MVRRLFFQAVSILAVIIGLAFPLSVAALTDPYLGVNCSGEAASSSICKSKGQTEDPITGTNGTLYKATNIVSLIAGFMAVIFLILGGIKYITSGGSPDQISKAKDSIVYALVGVVVIVIARSLIGFVLSKI